ncbi:MAG: DUF1826 domain-containing protein [Sphingorhabdus sp.]
MIATYAEVMEDWTRINERDCPLVIEERASPLGDADISPLLAKAPFVLRAEGVVDMLTGQLVELPVALIADIQALAARFAELTGNSELRVRLEGVTTNACKKVHADYTDVRLITTYAGPGTDYAPHGDPECCLERMPAGWIGLFKGRLFGDGHEPCMHRSPPIEGSGEARLVLIIDTPAREISNN